MLYIGGSKVAIDSQIKRGSAELAILLLLGDQPLHGYEIAKRIERLTGRPAEYTMQ